MKKLLPLAMFLAAIGIVAVASSAPATWTFDGSPSVPTTLYSSGSLAGWDITIDGAENGDQGFTTSQAHHGADCGPHPATHPVSSFENAVFQCRDHFMTVGEGGDGKYTIISLTPPALLDFSGGSGCVSVDISTWRGSDRDWWELWLTPFADNLTEPHQDFLPAANGEPRNGIMIKGTEGRSDLQAHVVRNFNATHVASAHYPNFIGAPSATNRLPHELCVTQTSLTFKVNGQTALSATFASLGWNKAVFQIQHSTYNPAKGSCVQGCGVNTWHWDNVRISPSQDFTIIRSNVRTYGIRQNGTFTFHSPAPAGSFLRFSGLGLWDYSVNGGQTWAPVTRQAQEDNRPEHSSSYWVAVPAGTTSVMLRGRQNSWNPNWIARDVSIWSLTAGSIPPTATTTPSATPVAPSPTSTNTVVPPTAPPTATNTPVAPTPTSTPQPTADCILTWNGVEVRRTVTTEAECN